MKLLTILGTRPQYIKAAPISQALRKHAQVTEVIVDTGQHYDANMSSTFIDQLAIRGIEYQLDVRESDRLDQVATMLRGLKVAFHEQQPDVAMVYGDTNSTLAGALAANINGVPLVHIEAGLRSFNRQMPEENNRIVTDALAQLKCCTSDVAAQNLRREGCAEEEIIVVGDVMYDAVKFAQGRQADAANQSDDNGSRQPYVVATIHRNYNTDDPKRLAWIADVFMALSETVKVKFVVHPRTRKALAAISHRILEDTNANLDLLPPLDYFATQALLGNSALVITDSGGLQKEAYYNNVGCVCFRSETEWLELLQEGWAELMDFSLDVPGAKRFIIERLGLRGNPGEFYGDGDAASKIAAAMVQRFG